MKNIRNIVIGVIIGILITSSFAFGADIIRNSYFNPDLKLAINGKPVQDLRIVTVELEDEQYGRNYYSIADLVKAFNDYGGINVKVDFDANTKTTIVEVEQKETEIGIIPTPKPIESTEPTEIVESNNSMEGGEDDIMEIPINKYGLPDFSSYDNINTLIKSDDKYEFIIYEDKKYINIISSPLRPHILNENLMFIRNVIDGKFGDIVILNKFNSETLKWETAIEEVPHFTTNNGKCFILYEYYINTILPMIKGA